MKTYKTICLIVAAGSGQRLNSQVPKQYLPLGKMAILAHSIKAFLNHPEIDGVRVVYNPEHQAYYDQATANLALLDPVAGGATRQESVYLGLQSIAQYSPRKILIHDAARPFISEKIISDIIHSLDSNNAVIPAIELSDTIKKCENNQISTTISRENLYKAQTPQGFNFQKIYEISSTKEQTTFTDEASLFEYSNLPVKIITGDIKNFKVTNLADLKMAEIIMENSFETRTGLGFDAHKFCAPKLQSDNFIMLCGVKIPHDMSLDGHSDADVGLHAAVDAILGAISAGDIGTHFPPSDNKWKNADSSIFLAHAAKLASKQGAKIINLDITIICERPKVLPHRDKMCETIAKILGIEKTRVSVKATTTEGMGFTGRKEGIAAQALANIQKLK